VLGPEKCVIGEASLAGGLPDPRMVWPMSSRLTRVEEHRWVGDKRTMLVHDQDNVCDPAVLDDIAAAGSWLAFGPDTSVEARNRGYRVCRACAANAAE
jgi:hypothetical protein